MTKDTVDPAVHEGHIKYFPPGTTFESRKDLASARIHPSLQAGIYRGPGVGEPARSIVMSNRPEYPNEDHGETFTYIGMGGWGDDAEVEEKEGDDTGGSGRMQTRPRRNTHSNHQTHDQSFDNPLNKALQTAADQISLVRVTRGAGASKYAPAQGFRYDGVYTVSNARLETGPSGKLVCKFDFTRKADQASLPVVDSS